MASQFRRALSKAGLTRSASARAWAMMRALSMKRCSQSPQRARNHPNLPTFYKGRSRSFFNENLERIWFAGRQHVPTCVQPSAQFATSLGSTPCWWFQVVSAVGCARGERPDGQDDLVAGFIGQKVRFFSHLTLQSQARRGWGSCDATENSPRFERATDWLNDLDSIPS